MSTSKLLREIESKIKLKIRFGESEAEIIRDIQAKYEDQIGTAESKELCKEVISNYGDFRLIQKIMRSKIVQEISGRDCYVLDTETRQAIKITRERLKEIIHPKKDICDRIYTCAFKYDPYNLRQIYEDFKGNWVYNVYRAPAWQADAFYDGIPVVQQLELPALYRKFILHLVDNDMASFDYVLDWLANAIQRRNYCILTTIGQSGIGKGTLGEIMKGVVGAENFGETGNRILAERFNAQIKHKRIVYVDEVSIKSQKEEERLKALVNNAIEVEAKGKDAEQIDNHASFYMSSNSMDAIKIYADDRRYSIVSLTNTKLLEVMEASEIKSLTEEKNIEELAKYLFYRLVDENKMLKVFVSERTEQIRSAGLQTWHDWFLDEYAVDKAGQSVKIDEISHAISEIYNRIRPGKKAFKELESMYPEKLKVYKPTENNKQIWKVKFPERR